MHSPFLDGVWKKPYWRGWDGEKEYDPRPEGEGDKNKSR